MRCVTATLLFLASPVPLLSAQDPQGPSPSHVQAAEQLLLILGMDSMARQTAPMFEALKQQPGMPADLMTTWQEISAKYLKWDDLKPEFIAAYAAVFTEAEIRRLIAFYRTPVGAKLIAVTPQLTARTMGIVQRRLQPHMGELMDAIVRRPPPPPDSEP